MKNIISYVAAWLVIRLTIIFSMIGVVDYIGINTNKGIMRCFFAWLIIWAVFEFYHRAEVRLESMMKNIMER